MNLDRLLCKLEALYPEHKVFALSALDHELRESLATSYKALGYQTLDALLHDNGYEIISGNAVKEIRPFVMYTPGNEPAVVANKMRSILNRLADYYPNRQIVGSMQKEHKSLYKDLSGMYQWLGYDDINSMLAAYGYQRISAEKGRPENDFDAIVTYLIGKYEDAPKPKNLGLLIFDNPDLRGPLKSMQNRAPELYGMSLKQYFNELGILAEKGENAAAIQTDKAPVGGKMKEAAENELRGLYQSGAQGTYDTIDTLNKTLQTIVVKQNKSRMIYVQQVLGEPEFVRIPYGVHQLADGVFARCRRLRRVELPETLEEIGKETFYNCESLEQVNFPNGLMSIGKRAFANCPKLENPDFSRCSAKLADDAFDVPVSELIQPSKDTEKSDFVYSVEKTRTITITGYHGANTVMVIPESIAGLPVTAIAREAFAGHSELTEVDMPDSIVNMGAQAFVSCSNLRRIHLSEGITRLYANTFNACTSLTEINIPDSVTELKRNTFNDSPLERLHIGKGLQTLHAEALKGVEWDDVGNRYSRGRITIVSVSSENPYLGAEGTMILSKDRKIVIAALGKERVMVIPDGVERIAAGAFKNLTDLTDISLSETLETIEEGAFAGTALRTVNFPESLRRIEGAAFSYCPNLSAVLFAEGIESIGRCAFAGCPISSLYLPASLTEIEEAAFSFMDVNGWDNRLRQLVIADGNPKYKAQDGVFYESEDQEWILKKVVNKESITVTIADGTKCIADKAFSGMMQLKHVLLPDSLVKIGAEAFNDCPELRSVRLPSGLREIGTHAFWNTAIKDVTLPTGLEKLGGGAFTNCKLRFEGYNPRFISDQNMLYTKLEDGSLRATAFSGKADKVLLRTETTEIGEYAFSRADLRELYIPSSVSIIHEEAFEQCEGLRRLYIEQRDNRRWAVIYLPEEDDNGLFFFATRGERDQLMDCIRFNANGDLFDYVKYDSLFETISDKQDAILIAVDRLKSGVDLKSVYQQNYERFLRNNARSAIESVINEDDVSGCHLLCNLGMIQKNNLADAITLATKNRHAGVASFLLDYQNKNELNPDPMAEFTLDW